MFRIQKPFIIRRQLLYTQHLVFTKHLRWLAANKITVELTSPCYYANIENIHWTNKLVVLLPVFTQTLISNLASDVT